MVVTPVEILEKTRDLLSDPVSWTQHTWARNERGELTDYRGADACKFCIGGAFFRTAEGSERSVRIRAWDHVMVATYSNTFIWNDAPERTHAEVLEALDKAIELARSE